MRLAIDGDGKGKGKGSIGELVASFAPFEQAFAERRRAALLPDYP